MYIGIAAIFYVVMRKIFKDDVDRDDVVWWASMWILYIPFGVLLSPAFLFVQLTNMIDEDIEKKGADVVEVRHGEWLDNTNGTFTCSVCGGRSSKMDWCGRCGARMDGGKTDA